MTNKDKIQHPDVIVQGVQNNDRVVLKKLYEQNFNRTRNYILQNSGTEENAKDIYQEAFIAFWKNVRENRFKTENSGSLEAYIFTIAKNKWLDHLRMGKSGKNIRIVKLPVMETADTNEAERENDYEYKLEMAMQAISHLGEECKEMLKQFYFHKRSLRAISEMFGINENSARNKKYRCIQQLREILTDTE